MELIRELADYFRHNFRMPAWEATDTAERIAENLECADGIQDAEMELEKYGLTIDDIYELAA